MADIFMESFVVGDIDLDYEFDAPQFYEFTQSETLLEAEEAERWFKVAGSYPPSPFIVKLNRKSDSPEEITKSFSTSPDRKNLNTANSKLNRSLSSPSANKKGLKLYNLVVEDISKAKPKSPRPQLTRSSTLMKPTASHLAKQKLPPKVHSNHFLRFGKFSAKS